MANFSLWDPRKNQDYIFLDETILEMFSVGATSIFVYKYLGVNGGNDPSEIEDPVFQENRSRNYDKDVYELLGVHNVHDLDVELTQFGQMISSDYIFMTMHLNDSIRRLGRKIMAGDVFEIPHLRDDALLREDTPAVNKYYVVDEVTREADGYSPTWYPHLLRIKLKVMTNSQEYEDILTLPPLDGNGDPIEGDGNGSGPNGELTLEDIISDYKQKMNLNDKIVKEAEEAVDRRNYQTLQFYVVPGDELNTQYPWIFAGDGHPPNGAELAGYGTSFPVEDVYEGMWFLRTDFEPNVLFRKTGVSWKRYEVDWRKKWQAAHRILETFINNRNITTIDGDSFNERQAISKALKPQADF